MQADRDSPRLDALRIFEELARHEVNFVLVGGLAAQTHGNTQTAVGRRRLAFM